MKSFTISAILALTSAVLSSPIEDIQKRATCTIFGYPYPCVSTATSAATTTTTRSTNTAVITRTTTSSSTIASTTPAATSPTNNPPNTSSGTKYTTGSSATDITTNTGCTDLNLIFARGTSEPGNIGSIAGPPLFKKLLSDLGAQSLTLQGVNYPADSAGNANCGAAGGPNMATLANTVLSRCPETKVVLAGYSQGACVVHNAVEKQGLDVGGIAATVVFGDPFNGRTVGGVPASRSLSICAAGDSVCAGGPSGNGAGSGHLSYGQDAGQAAGFIERITAALVGA